MQYAYSLTHSAWAGVERVLSPQRIGRYLPAARGDKQLAFRLYLWNLRLCEAFYLPCHFCEVAIRNGLHEALKARFGSEDWHLDQKVLAILPERQKVELTDVIRRARAEHGDGATIHHLVSQLPLGFWSGRFRWRACGKRTRPPQSASSSSESGATAFFITTLSSIRGPQPSCRTSMS